MKKTTKVVSILLLLVLSLTACNGKASGTSGSSATAAPATNESQATAQNTSEDVSSTAVSESDSSDSSPADITEDVSEPSEPVSPIGTVDHPVAVDPTPYWHGEDYFDIIGYFRDCGSESFSWRTESGEKVGFRGQIGNRSVSILGDTHITAFVDVGNADIRDTSNTYIALDSGNNKYVWLDQEHTLKTYSSTLEILFTVMPNVCLNEENGCPFAGLGIEHSKMGIPCND